MGHLDRMIKAFAHALVLGCLSALPAAAQTAFEIPVQGEVLHGWQQADGSRVGAIKLTLAPGWKTYWRAPGDAGIPPSLDWSGSRNLQAVAVTWPTPQVFDQGGLRSLGYENELVLPITFVPRQPGKALKLRVDMDIGVCSDICVPHQMTLKATIKDANTAPSPVIAAALADTPYTAAEAGVTSATCELRPNETGLEIEAALTLPHAGGSEVVVIEPGQADLWMSETDTARHGGTLTAVGDLVSNSGKPMAIDRSKIRISVFGKNHAVDIKGCPSG